MKRQGAFAFLISIAVLFSTVPPAHAAITGTQALAMTQGQFALALVREAGAINRLSPAATGQDAIDFLASLGIIPAEGWAADQPVTDAFLRSLVENAPEGATLDQIIQQIMTNIESGLLNLPADQNVNSGSTGPS